MPELRWYGTETPGEDYSVAKRTGLTGYQYFWILVGSLVIFMFSFYTYLGLIPSPCSFCRMRLKKRKFPNIGKSRRRWFSRFSLRSPKKDGQINSEGSIVKMHQESGEVSRKELQLTSAVIQEVKEEVRDTREITVAVDDEVSKPPPKLSHMGQSLHNLNVKGGAFLST
jgi:hypothetical protein